jgi:hypothetical protein
MWCCKSAVYDHAWIPSKSYTYQVSGLSAFAMQVERKTSIGGGGGYISQVLLLILP